MRNHMDEPLRDSLRATRKAECLKTYSSVRMNTPYNGNTVYGQHSSGLSGLLDTSPTLKFYILCMFYLYHLYSHQILTSILFFENYC